jgi:hypothetical protein
VTLEILEKEPSEPDHPYREVLSNLDDREDGTTITQVPAGVLGLSASRAGFRSRELTVKLSPEGRQAVTVPALEPINGILVLHCPVPGARVTVLDEFGEEIVSETVGDAGEPLELEVRVGTSRNVRIMHDEHHPFEQIVNEISEGARTTLKAELQEKDGQVIVSGPAGGLLTFTLKGPEPMVRRSSIEPSGSVKVSLPPGEYTVEMIDGETTESLEVVVSAAKEAQLRFGE